MQQCRTVMLARRWLNANVSRWLTKANRISNISSSTLKCLTSLQIFTVHCHFSSLLISTILIKTCSYVLIWLLKWQIHQSPAYQMFTVSSNLNSIIWYVCFLYILPKSCSQKLRSCTLHVFKRRSVKPLCCAAKPVVSKLTLAVQREALRRGPSRTSIKSHPLDCRGKSDLQQLQQIVTLQSNHKEVDV